MKFLIILILCQLLLAQKADFTLRIVFLKPDRSDVVQKLNVFASELEKQLNSFDWLFPHTDFEKIETNISVNIDRHSSVSSFTGMMTISSGPASDTRQFVPLRKNIFITEQDMSFIIDFENEPRLTRDEAGSLETVILFYSYLVMGENFDRLSYTERENFTLSGDFYYTRMYSFENMLTGASDRRDWNKRIELMNDYRMNRNIGTRRINAMLYNAVWFINTGKRERAALFVDPLYDLFVQTDNIPEIFFTNNFYALGEVFALGSDDKYFDLLVGKDPSREVFYRNKMNQRQIQPFGR